MFEKSLQDLVKGIRNNKNDPSAYIAACVAEIKAELRSRDSDLKAQVGVRGAGAGSVRVPTPARGGSMQFDALRVACH